MPKKAPEGAGQASEPSRAPNPRIIELEQEFKRLRNAWDDAQSDDPTDYGDLVTAVMAAVLAEDIRTPSDAAKKMRIAMERSCWSPKSEQVAFDILRQVVTYLDGLGDG